MGRQLCTELLTEIECSTAEFSNFLLIKREVFAILDMKMTNKFVVFI